DPPSHRRKAVRSAHTDDRARDRVRRAHRNAEPRREQDRKRARRLGAKSTYWSKTRDARAHRVDDAPPPEERSQRDHHVRRNLYPQRDVIRRLQVEVMQQPGLEPENLLRRNEQPGDDAHRLLRVISAVREGEERRAAELGEAKDAIDTMRRGAPEDPINA